SRHMPCAACASELIGHERRVGSAVRRSTDHVVADRSRAFRLRGAAFIARRKCESFSNWVRCESRQPRSGLGVAYGNVPPQGHTHITFLNSQFPIFFLYFFLLYSECYVLG